MLVSTNAAGGSIAYGKAIQVSSGAGVPIISHNGFGQAVTGIASLTVPPAVVLTTTTSASSGPPTLQDVGGLDLDWGRWDHTQLNALSNTLTPSSNAFPTHDVEWAVFQPANMASLTGTYRYGTSSGVPISGIDDIGGHLRGGTVEFDVNLGGGVDAISNGLLRVFDSRNSTWSVTFNGDVTGAFATMKDITGTLNSAGNVTGAIGGVFTGTGPKPAFVSGFSLQSGGSFVQGITLLNGTNCLSCTLP